MATQAPSTNQFKLPRLKAIFKLAPDPKAGKSKRTFWDAKFYPYDSFQRDQPILAIVETNELMICKLSDNVDEPITVLHSSIDEGRLPKDNRYPNIERSRDGINSCTWCYVDPSEPLVGVAGDSGQIKLINAINGTLYKTLVGHGLGTINDLATHPLYPWIIASASLDTSVRIWDLRRLKDDKEYPCIIICGHGNGHKAELLTISWHDRGRYLISGAQDHRVCIWTLPDLSPESQFWGEIARENWKRSSDDVRVIYYPHFVTGAIHSDYVDRVAFLGDLVVSKAAQENKIVLWKVTGFNSRELPPEPVTAPKTGEHLDNRNGFVRTKKEDRDGTVQVVVDERFQEMPLCERLLEFDVPNCQSFYMRFGLLKPSPMYPDLHPVLAIGNHFSQAFFWDFERLDLGHDGGLGASSSREYNTFRKPSAKKKGIATRVKATMKSVNSFAASASPDAPPSPSSSRRSSSFVTSASSVRNRESSTAATSPMPELSPSVEGPIPDRVKYCIDDPYKRLTAHVESVLPEFKYFFSARATAWSPCGRWCAIVGEANNSEQVSTAVVSIYERWT